MWLVKLRVARDDDPYPPVEYVETDWTDQADRVGNGDVVLGLKPALCEVD